MYCKLYKYLLLKGYVLMLNSVCDKSVRYVAEENIEPVSPNTEPSEAIMRLAGRHFKRWDADAHLFVSNMRDEYPHD
jgi:F-box protein 21